MKTNLFKRTKSIYKASAFVIIAMFGLTFISCDKTENLTTDDQFSDVVNESYAEEVFDEVEDIGDEAVDYLDNATTKSASYDFGNYYRLSPCATITREYKEDTVNVTIDFGEENCLCLDGRERRGKLYIHHYGYYWGDTEVEIEYSFDNYFVDDDQLTGTRNVYRYMNENQHRISEIVCDGSIILAEQAGIITRHAEQVREVIEGSETHRKYDDVIQLTGTSHSVLADGTEITSEITTPLVRKNESGCFRNFVSGVRQIMRGDDEIIIDYGDGTCDNIAEFTKNGETHTYEIRRRTRFSW